MRFDLVDLQLFIAVAETRSITNGAAKVHLALASASARIKGLEEALGVSLLTRGRRGVELTPAGESLLDHARVVIHNVEAMRGDLLAYASGAKATVRFLANTSGLSEYLPKALAAFLSQHPHISIDVEERESSDIARAILTGSADLGLAAEHALPGQYRADPVQRRSPGAGRSPRRRTGKPAAGRFRRSGGARFRRPDQFDRAAYPCQRARRAARRAPAVSRAAEQFRCDRPDGRRRHRRRGHA